MDSDPTLDPPQAALDKLDEIKRSLNRLAVATVVLFLLVCGVAVYAYSEASKNKDALCTLRADLEKRVETSKDFLIENPEGIPGITAKAIRDGIKNQERTVAALSGLSC